MSDIDDVRAATGELRELAAQDQEKINKLTKKLDRHEDINHFAEMITTAMSNRRKA